MGGPDYVYVEEEEKLLLKNLEQGETEINILGSTLKTVLKKTREGFKLSLSTLKGETTIKTLVVENAGPAVLRTTQELSEKIESFRLSWDGRNLKIVGLRLSEKPVELDFIIVPMDLSIF